MVECFKALPLVLALAVRFWRWLRHWKLLHQVTSSVFVMCIKAYVGLHVFAFIFLVLWLYCLCCLFYSWLHTLRNNKWMIKVAPYCENIENKEPWCFVWCKFSVLWHDIYKKMGVTAHFFILWPFQIPPSDEDLTWDSLGKVATCPIFCWIT